MENYLCFFFALVADFFFGVNGFGGVLSALPIPRKKRSSAPGSSSIFGFLGSFPMPQQASSDANTVSYRALEDLSHNAELAQAIGNMVITWARTEIEIFSIFARVAEVGLNMAMESYAHIPTFESRIKFTLALLNEWQTDEFDIPAIRREIEGLNGLIGTRNRWIHGDWCANADKSETVVFNHRRPSDHAQRRSPVKANDIKVHCEAVRTRARKLNELIRGSDLTP